MLLSVRCTALGRAAAAKATHARDRAPAAALPPQVPRHARHSALRAVKMRARAPLRRRTSAALQRSVLAAASADAPAQPNVTVDVLREVAVLGVPILGAALSEPVRVAKASSKSVCKI
jgi:hypothetical protein